MLSTAGIAITFDNDEMPSATQKGVSKLLDGLLAKCGFTGIWRVSPVHRSKGGRKPFAANRLSETRGGESSVKIITMLKGPDDTWESHLIPPSDYALDDVLAALGGSDDKVVPTTTKEDRVPEPVVKETSAAQLEIGTVFRGKVSSVQSYGAFVDLCDGVTGLCHITEWDNNFVSDMNRVAKIGQSINVMLTKIKDDGKLDLSRRSALNCPADTIINASEEVQRFKGNVNDKGELIIRGFVKDGQPNAIENLLWLLHVMAMAYSSDSIVSQARMTPPGARYIVKVSPIFVKAICVKFDVPGIASPAGPLVKSLTSKGWIEHIWKAGDKVGYRITDLGWQELGGHLKYVSGEQADRCIMAPREVQVSESLMPSSSESSEPVQTQTKEPITMNSPTTTEGDPTMDGIDVDLLREYKEKIARMADIEVELQPHDEIVLLVMEKIELQEWMDDRPGMVSNYREAQSRMKSMREALGELEEIMGDGSN